MSTLFSDLSTQVRGNARLQLALWAVLGIVLVNFGLTLADDRQRLESEYEQLSSRLSRLEALSGQRDWEARVREAGELKEGWRQMLWKAKSRGLSQALADESIREALGEGHRSGIQIDIGSLAAIPGLDDVWQLQVSVEGILKPADLLDFLHRIEAHPQAIAITQLKLDDNGRSGFLFTMLATLLFELSANAAGEPGS